jgi:hypothetical protein
VGGIWWSSFPVHTGVFFKRLSSKKSEDNKKVIDYPKGFKQSFELYRLKQKFFESYFV